MVSRCIVTTAQMISSMTLSQSASRRITDTAITTHTMAIALTRVRREIVPPSLYAFRYSPKYGLSRILAYILGFAEKQKAAAMTKGVVGRMGRNTPRKPSANSTAPRASIALVLNVTPRSM